MTRYVIIGAGAIGGGVAGQLADAGIEVLAIARGEHAAAMQAHGLTLRTPEGERLVTMPCVTDPSDASLRPDDILVLATKTHQAEDALRTWVDVPVSDRGRIVGTAGETLPVVTALNGVVSEDLALRFFDRVIGACVWMPAVFLRPGEVILRGTPIRGTFHVGSVPADRNESAVLDAIERDWTAGGFRIVRPADVMPWKYRKLISNLGNAVQALVGNVDKLGRVVGPAVDEARTVLAGAGIDVVDDEAEAAERAASGLRIEPVPGAPEQLGGSSWQSLARGTGDIESDYLNGEVAAIARRTGQRAPVNAGLARLARQAAASGQRPGDLSLDELQALLDLA